MAEQPAFGTCFWRQLTFNFRRCQHEVSAKEYEEVVRV